MKKSKANGEYIVLYRFKKSEAVNAQEIDKSPVDNWYIYTHATMYEKIFNEKLQGKNKYPWKRRVVKIYSKDTGMSVYRIWKGAFVNVLSEGIVYVDKEAKFILCPNKTADLVFTPSNKFKYYWNHFAPEMRAPFKVSMGSLFIGIISLVVAIIPIIWGNVKGRFFLSKELGIEEKERNSEQSDETHDNELEDNFWFNSETEEKPNQECRRDVYFIQGKDK